MSSITVEEIISQYQTNKTHTRTPRPHAIFIVVNGKSIYELLKNNLGRRPTLLEVRTAYKSEWQGLSSSEVDLYNEAASKLGYNPKTFNFNREQSTLKARINARFRDLQRDKDTNK